MRLFEQTRYDQSVLSNKLNIQPPMDTFLFAEANAFVYRPAEGASRCNIVPFLTRIDPLNDETAHHAHLGGVTGSDDAPVDAACTQNEEVNRFTLQTLKSNLVMVQSLVKLCLFLAALAAEPSSVSAIGFELSTASCDGDPFDGECSGDAK